MPELPVDNRTHNFDEVAAALLTTAL